MPDVINGVAQNGDAFHTHPEGEPGVNLWIDTTACKNVGVDHPTAKNLEPACPAAYAATRAVAPNAFNSDLATRFDERKVITTEPDA